MAGEFTRMISADSHIFEDPYLWEKTLGDRYGDEIPHHVPEFNGRKGNYFYTGRHHVLLGDVDKEYRGKDRLTRAGYEPEPRVEFQKEAGVDAEVLYPTLALVLMQSRHFEALTAVAEVYNDWLHEYCSHDPKRLLALGLIPIVDVDWAIGELDRLARRGFRGVIINARASIGTPAYHDPLYDPFWARCVELGFPVAAHSGGMGFHERSSISNYMHNHMGHFAAAGEVLAKSLLMGGVTYRFPDLRVALLEGGVVSGTRLYADIVGRWKKRNVRALENLNPANIDLEQAKGLFERYGDGGTRATLEQLPRALGMDGHDIPPEVRDDFAAMGVSKAEDIPERFIPNFYFGCESDDPHACFAFNRKANPFGEQVRAIMSFDLGHWDVTDMGHAAAEAYEQLEYDLIDEADFRNFAFTHSVQLYGGPNSDFFKGTRIEDEARVELAA